ncbi:pro-resilin-like isoform X2 [Ostrinia furnacalis]|uniref:pro-resilin-like isoform X2 n=1 Tax=Ostrinia furnacalis TaxID=93504 RepID=UPI00103CF7B9|nr:pro-resilin-like isoform X2 [Ostrinia furnacalis]
MKVLVAVSVLVAFVLAEPPPSNSYLPPPSNGYPQGPQSSAPQVVAARALDQGRGSLARSAPHGASAAAAFGRSSPLGHAGHGAQGRFAVNPEQGYDRNASPFGRNALEESSTVSYEADERGFKPHISYEDSESDLTRSAGYDSNANNLRSANHDSGSQGYPNGGHHGNSFSNGGSHHGNGFANGGRHHDSKNGARSGY